MTERPNDTEERRIREAYASADDVIPARYAEWWYVRVLLAEVDALRADLGIANERGDAWREEVRAAVAEREQDIATLADLHRQRDEWQAKWEAAEARITAALAQLDAGAPTSWGDAAVEGFDWLAIAVRAALTAPGEPQRESCATCDDWLYICDHGGDIGRWCASPECPSNRRPCPCSAPPEATT